MMKRKNIARLLLCTVLLTGLLCACGSKALTQNAQMQTNNRELQATADAGEAPVLSTDHPQENTARFYSSGATDPNNISGAAPMTGEYPAQNGDGFYRAELRIRCYDIALCAEFTACIRAGCIHNDETCPAYFPHLKAFLNAGSSWLIFSQKEAEALVLIQVDPQSGARTQLCSYADTANRYTYYLRTCFYSFDRVFFTIAEVDMKDQIERCIHACYDLAQSRLLTIAKDSETESTELLCASDREVLLNRSVMDAPPPSYEDFFAENPNATEDDYYDALGQFGAEHIKSQFCAVRLDTLEQAVLREPAVSLFTGPRSADSNGFVYYEDSSAMYYDFATGKVSSLVQADGLINAWLLDQKLTYLTLDGDAVYIFVMDLVSGETISVDNQGAAFILFSPHTETPSAFIGIYQEKSAWIRKDDFYAGAFENAVFY